MRPAYCLTWSYVCVLKLHTSKVMSKIARQGGGTARALVCSAAINSL